MHPTSHDTLVVRLSRMLLKLNQEKRLDPQALASEFGVNLCTVFEHDPSIEPRLQQEDGIWLSQEKKEVVLKVAKAATSSAVS